MKPLVIVAVWFLVHWLVNAICLAVFWYRLIKATPRGGVVPSPHQSIKFEPRDLWIGWFWDRNPFTLYACPVPGVDIKLSNPDQEGEG